MKIKNQNKLTLGGVYLFSINIIYRFNKNGSTAMASIVRQQQQKEEKIIKLYIFSCSNINIRVN